MKAAVSFQRSAISQNKTGAPFWMRPSVTVGTSLLTNNYPPPTNNRL
jgi:hypothetical protein